jgi:hypothetical protein
MDIRALIMQAESQWWDFVCGGQTNERDELKNTIRLLMENGWSREKALAIGDAEEAEKNMGTARHALFIEDVHRIYDAAEKSRNEMGEGIVQSEFGDEHKLES